MRAEQNDGVQDCSRRTRYRMCGGANGGFGATRGGGSHGEWAGGSQSVRGLMGQGGWMPVRGWGGWVLCCAVLLRPRAVLAVACVGITACHCAESRLAGWGGVGRSSKCLLLAIPHYHGVRPGPVPSFFASETRHEDCTRGPESEHSSPMGGVGRGPHLRCTCAALALQAQAEWDALLGG